jgi:hypothetical protein
MTWTIVDHVEVGFADGNAGHVVSLPGGVAAVAGDIDAIIIGSDTTVSTPSGFTLPTNGSFVNNQGGYAVYRVCTGGETASVTITTSGNFDTSVGWVRIRGGAASPFDLAANGHVDGNGQLFSPTLATGTLAQTGEFVFAGSVMTDAVGAVPASPSWTGATALGAASSGTGANMSAGFWGYNNNLGTATSNLSVSWTPDGMRNRYIFLLAFKPGTGTSASAEAPSGAGAAQAPTAALGANAEAPSATGTAFDAAASYPVSVAAEQPTGAGAAQDANASVGANAAQPGAAGTAADANVSAGILAGQPTGAGTAADAFGAAGANAGAATGAGTALDAGVLTGPTLQAFDTTGSTALTAAATSAVVDITAAATGAWCYAWCALGLNSGAISSTGWTSLLDADEGTSAHYALLRRKKQSGDTTFTFSWTTSTKGTIGWASYTGLDATTPDEQATLATNGVTGRTAVPGPAATPTAASRWVVAFSAVRTTNVANKPITWTPDAATTERLDVDNNAAGSAPWLGLEIADTATAVTQAAHSYTATHNASESHDGSATLYLISATSGGVNAAAEQPTGTGTAADANAAITVNAEAPAATGAAPDATASVGALAEQPTGTGAASDAAVSVGAQAQQPTGTCTAADATSAVTVNAEAPTGAGAAFDATASLGAQAGQPTGTGTAGNAVPSIAVNAEQPTGTGTAFDATVSTASNVNAPAEAATGTGAAFDATVSTSAFANAPAEAASAAGVAFDASTAVTGTAEAPAAGGQAFDVVVSTTAGLQAATASGAAFDAAIIITSSAATATGAGFAYDATTQTYAVGVATATGTAFNATVLTTTGIPPVLPTRVVVGPQRATYISVRQSVVVVVGPQRAIVISDSG